MNSTPHTSHFLVFHSTHSNVTLTLAQEQGVWRALHTCVILMRSYCVLLNSLRLSLLLCAFHLLSDLPPDLHLLLPCGGQVPCALSRMRTLGTLAENDPLTDYEPNDLHISETTEPYIQESSNDSRPSNLHDLDVDDFTIGRALSSPLFTQEREDDASRRRAQHSLDESSLSSQSLSVGKVITWRRVDEFDSLISNVRENPCRDSGDEQIRILLERQKEQILADCRAEIQKHEFQADYDRRNIQKLNEVIGSQREEIYRAHEGDEQLRRDQQLLHEQFFEAKLGSS